MGKLKALISEHGLIGAQKILNKIKHFGDTNKKKDKKDERQKSF